MTYIADNCVISVFPCFVSQDEPEKVIGDCNEGTFVDHLILTLLTPDLTNFDIYIFKL
jgi:hypothetical protein